MSPKPPSTPQSTPLTPGAHLFNTMREAFEECIPGAKDQKSVAWFDMPQEYRDSLEIAALKLEDESFECGYKQAIIDMREELEALELVGSKEKKRDA